MTPETLPTLPYDQWEPTKTTVHLWSQIVGKIKLQYAPYRNHWWNVTLHPTPRGLSSYRVPLDDATFFEIAFDFVDHRLTIGSNRTHEPSSFALEDGLSVAEFFVKVREALGAMGIGVHVLAKPYGLPIETPFLEDTGHHSYDRTMVRRWWEILLWSAGVFDRFAGPFHGKQSVPQIFWHSLDLAMTRFSGRRAPGPPSANPVEREAYSHEVISFGFWAGDANIAEPAYYTYAAPEPAGLIELPLRPEGALWRPSGNGHLGILPYETVRGSSDPAATLLEFLTSGYEAGTRAAQWEVTAF